METGLRRLRYFSVLASELSFRKSAERLNITQPALSRAIAQLEAEVGARLVERSSRRVWLTAAGESFASGCARLLTGLDATIDQTLLVAEGYAGTVVVGYTDTAIAGHLPDFIKSFLSEAPQVHVRLFQMYSEQQLGALHEGTIDIGIMTGPVTERGLEAVDVQVDRFVALVPRDNGLATAHSITLAALAEYPFVLGDRVAWAVYNAQLYAHFEKAGLSPHIVQAAPESRAILGLVACGLGVSIMPESLTGSLDPRIAALPIRDLDGCMITQAVWPADTNKPAVVRFGRHLASEAARRAT